MDTFAYDGTWAACGSYALLHALGETDINLIDLENSTGASFGVKHMGDNFGYTRMLTAFRDFHCGIDDVAPLWGISIRRFDADRPGDLDEVFRDTSVNRLVVGPISMMKLAYLPLAQQYKYADHYFACIRADGENWKIIDSEGMAGLRIDAESLKRMLSVQGIPEAGGRITVRAVEAFRELQPTCSDRAYIRYTLDKAYRNLKEAEAEAQGAKAFLHCIETMKNVPMNRWRESVIYDMDYYVQRKLMLLRLLHNAVQLGCAEMKKEMADIVFRQIACAGVIRTELFHKLEESLEYMLRSLSKLEYEMVRNWEEWIVYDRVS